MLETTERIIELALMGERTLVEIGEVVGLSGVRVGEILRENGYARELRTVIRNNRIVELWEAGDKSLEDLSRLFSLKVGTIIGIINGGGSSLTVRKHRLTPDNIIAMSRTGQYTIAELSRLSGMCLQAIRKVVGPNRRNLGDQVVCPRCQEPFTLTHYNQKYCPDCRATKRKYDKEIRAIRCDYCGLERNVRGRKERMNQHHFCSVEHAHIYANRERAIRNNTIRRKKARGLGFEEIAREANLAVKTVKDICGKPMETVLRLPGKERVSPRWKSSATKTRLRLEEKQTRESWRAG